MLEIKQVRPKETYDAIYITKDNTDEFLKFAYGYYGEPMDIERLDNGVIYVYDKFSAIIEYNCWYTKDTGYDSVGWELQLDFDNDYEVVDNE